MYDFGLSVLEQYGLEAKASYRGRGALIVETQQGQKIIKEYNGSEKKLNLQRQLQIHVKEHSDIKVDCILENQEGELISKDQDGASYVVRDWYHGRECDVKSESDIFFGMQMLGRLHTVMQFQMEVGDHRESLLEECMRHNQEIRKVRNYISRKKKKTDFERKLLSCSGWFCEQAEQAVMEMEKSFEKNMYQSAWEQGFLCHGDCNQHNMIFVQGKPMMVNYDRWKYDCQTSDVFYFMRKILEKNNWNIRLGQDMMEAYQKEKPMSEEEVWDLKIRLSYPWKFWKLVNRYAASSKPWLEQRYMEKLEGLLKQEEMWRSFLQQFPR